ncbi:MAG: T9SS type B sorting domain-containing protein [Saprospiraceae bacterium]|nr:T9SS type B sorting domain-containing protein [Saprospiraceae bacterium]
MPPDIICPNDTILNFSGNNCAVNFQLPLPKTLKDNCSTGTRTEIVLPSDSSQAFITFTFDPDLNDYLADNTTFVFKNLTANTLTDATLVISFRGDLDNENGFFTLLGDDNIPLATTALGQSNVTFGDCTRFSRTTVTIPASIFNNWASDGEIKITAVSNSAIPIPPGGAGDGVNPCDPSVVNEDGDRDGVSMMFATLTFDNTQYQYYTTGATIIPLTSIQNGDPLPTFEFAAGTTEVYYFVEDASGNADTCSFKIVVADTEKPKAICVGTTLSINPSGTVTDTLQVQDLDLGSSDNCRIDTMFVFPNVFDCTFINRDTVNVTLTVIDQSGNAATCKAPVRIIAEAPEPSYFISPCGGDTLYLFANPPNAVGNNAYTYEWTGPRGFVSRLQNPIITNISQENAGSYQLRVIGLTGCNARGIVEVAINDLPIVPTLNIPQKICSNEDLVLTTNTVPQGVNAAYKWYSGMPTEGVLIGTTLTPSLMLSAPLTKGTYNYYVLIEIDGCASSPSPVVTTKVVEVPIAIADNPNPAPICAGGSIRLGTFVVGTDLTYQWRGPNGFFSTAQIPPIIENASVNNDGVYQLTISREGCVSNPASVSVTVRPKPQKPILTTSGAACEGGNVTLRMNITDATVYHWQSPDGNRQITQTNTLSLSNISVQNAGTWRGYITRAGCDSDLSEPINIVVNNTPNLSLSANPLPICVGKNLQLNASPTLDGAIYEWTGPDNFRTVGQNPIINSIQPGKAGTYTCVITSAQGCTNTKQIEVEVQESVRITGVSNSSGNQCINGSMDVQLAVTVFPPDDGSYKYAWEGPNFSSTMNIATIPNATAANSGNYSIVVSTSDGCSSERRTTTVSLKNAPNAPTTPRPSETTPPPYCEGDLFTLITDSYSGANVEYVWLTPTGNRITTIPTLTINAADINDDGEYAVFVKVDGCDSRQSGTTRVRVSSVPEILVNATTPICEGDRLELEADLIPNAQYRWEGPSGFSASGTNPVIAHADPDLHNGTFRVRAIVNGCSSPEVSIDVVVNQVPKLPTVVTNAPVCIDAENAVLRLAVPAFNSTLGANYTWYNQDLVPLGSPTPNLVFNVTNFEGYGEGEYKFYVEAKLKGCSSGLSAPTVAKLNTQPTNQAFAGQDITVCETASINLNAALPSIGNGVWMQISGDTTGIVIANPDDPKTTIFGLEGGGIYTFQWTLSNGSCKDYSNDVVSIVLNPTEKVDAGAVIDTCAVGAVKLKAKAPITGQGKWTQPTVQTQLGVAIQNSNDPNTIVTGLQPGNLYSFTWTVTGGACDAIADEAIVIISNGFSYAGEDFNECGDGCAILNATASPTGVGRWSSLNPNIVFNEADDPTTLFCGLEEGKNMLFWTVDNEACGARSRDTLIVNYQPSAIATADTITLAFGSAATFDVTQNDNLANTAFKINIADTPSKGVIEDLGNGVFSYQANTSFSGIDGFTYEICALGCECTVVPVLINIGAETACRIPNIFTPNGDGINDAFVIPCLSSSNQFPDNKVTFFNQWGDEVYQKVGYTNDWEGTYNGEDLPSGTYFYIINFGDGTPPSNGFIIIQR